MKELLQEIFICLFLGTQFLQTLETLALLRRFQKRSLKATIILGLKIPAILLGLGFLHSPLLLVSLGLCLAIELYAWRFFSGPLNGASSSFNLLLLVFLFLSKALPNLEGFFLLYIVLQVILSYFVAGVVKVRESRWRSGRSLEKFLSLKPYAPDLQIHNNVLVKTIGWKALSWAVLIFELSFPIVIFMPDLLYFYLPAAVTFHLANFKVLGLNRFFWIWLSTYPLLISVFAARL